MEALERPEVLRRLTQLVAEVVRPAVHVTHFRRRHALRGCCKTPTCPI